MADATDSKSVVGDNVRVQVPPSAPNITNQEKWFVFFYFYGDIMTKETFKSFVKSINLFEICNNKIKGQSYIDCPLLLLNQL